MAQKVATARKIQTGDMGPPPPPLAGPHVWLEKYL